MRQEESGDWARGNAAVGCLLGMAVGDALGLPFERLYRAQFEYLMPMVGGHCFVFGRGMVSDDTEHACMVAQAVIASGGDPDRFAHSLAWRMRFWLLGLPAGIGSATLRGIQKLWVGYSPENSGVNSAGNGPSMRSPVLGVLFADDWPHCRELVRRSTIMTHTDPKALHAALAVALASGLASRADGAVSAALYESAMREKLDDMDSDLIAVIGRALASVSEGQPTEEFAASLGRFAGGVSGYSLHSIPVALHAWLSHPLDMESAVTAAIRCGGDTDTVAAITGGIVGAAVGRSGIPQDWLGGLLEWPCGVAWMARLGERSANAAAMRVQGKPLAFNIPGQFIRNLLFFAVVIAHGIFRSGISFTHRIP